MIDIQLCAAELVAESAYEGAQLHTGKIFGVFTMPWGFSFTVGMTIIFWEGRLKLGHPGTLQKALSEEKMLQKCVFEIRVKTHLRGTRSEL